MVKPKVTQSPTGLQKKEAPLLCDPTLPMQLQPDQRTCQPEQRRGSCGVYPCTETPAVNPSSFARRGKPLASPLCISPPLNTASGHLAGLDTALVPAPPPRDRTTLQARCGRAKALHTHTEGSCCICRPLEACRTNTVLS